MKKTIKLCEGFRVYNGVKLELQTDDWQDVREWLHLDVQSKEWSEITRNTFACGLTELTIKDEKGRVGNIYIEVIPCHE